jgi:hypothetical protein
VSGQKKCISCQRGECEDYPAGSREADAAWGHPTPAGWEALQSSARTAILAQRCAVGQDFVHEGDPGNVKRRRRLSAGRDPC